MLTLSLWAFIQFYIGNVITLFLLLSLFNAIITTGFSKAAFKLTKSEYIFIFTWPIIQFFLRLLFTGFLGFVIGVVAFIFLFEHLKKKFPN